MRMFFRAGTSGVDFALANNRFSSVIDRGASWLDDNGRRHLELGLHELLVNIRTHSYHNEDGPIDVLVSTSHDAVRIDVTDWGTKFEGEVIRPIPPGLRSGGYGLAIVSAVFDGVHYQRLSDRNWWALEIRRPAGESR
jgi:anti-sigma regulatory factor (Ser/Thr protein kinase)